MKQSPISFIHRQMRARPLACFSVFFLSGLLISNAYCVSSAAALIAGVMLLSMLLFCRRCRKICVVMLLAICMGVVRMNLLAPVESLSSDSFSVSMTGTVASDPYIKSDTGRLIFRFNLLSKDEESENMTVRMYLRGDASELEQIRYGQTLSVFGHLWAPDPITNPDQFDFGKYLSDNGMCGYATAKIEDTVILSSERNLKNALFDLRREISHRIDTLFTDNAAIVKALVLADRSQLSDDIRESFNKTGITHLICISGMHVSVLALSILFILKRFIQRRYATIIAFAMLLAYGVLIGFTSSYVRALIMFMVFSCAPISGYPSDGITRLCFAMFLTLIIAPSQITDAGFVLSYSATAGIILLYPPLTELFCISGALHRKPSGNKFRQLFGRFVLYFPKLLCATLSAQLATIPAVIEFFGVQSIVSIPANLICVPLCMIAYPISLIALLLSPLGMWAAEIPVFISESIFSLLSRVALLTASLPITGIRIGRYGVLLILLHAFIVLLSSNLCRIRASVRRFLPLAIMPLAFVSTIMVYIHGTGHTLLFLDAGQADCAVLRTEGRVYLIDTGDTYTPAADYLDGNCLRLDGVFLSHPDIDHAGGLDKILDIMPPKTLYIPCGWDNVADISDSVQKSMERAADMGVEIIELCAGDVISLSSSTIANVYAPKFNAAVSESNDVSMLLLIEHGNSSVLFTGDLPEECEPLSVPQADILKVAHHGSEESTSQRFLNSVTPDYAVISVGENSFGHPSDSVLEKLRNVGAQVIRTDESGAITFKLDKYGQWQMKTFLISEE